MFWKNFGYQEVSIEIMRFASFFQVLEDIGRKFTWNVLSVYFPVFDKALVREE